MSEPQLVTIDFLGIGRDGSATENTSSDMDCQRQVLKRRGIQSCLGKIKPHMLQQVLSDGYLSNLEHSHREDSEDLKTMELFPQHATGFRSDSEDRQLLFLDSETSSSEAAAAFDESKPPAKPSSSQLMLFYNGAVYFYGNVSSDKAKDIMSMAAGNGNTANTSNCEALSKGLKESVSDLEGSANGAKERHPLGISHWKLPIAKKKSLQRFLQKRKAG
ncbi:hypothetical protein SUGI_0796400 [Cryptomeria japonica]|uniref:protein TIFY 10a n=1 Tax=Cryptomeria japonica TaxID=3369 RepID=UPI002414C4DC|nr:protein TIFY 10a [Cryptomeria japonica]GLJ39066.1 hypothetical protein SUGI_0796400 [Cryptomeria japonica]